MNKSALGIAAIAVMLVGGAGCVVTQTPPPSRQEQGAAPTTTAEPSPEPTTDPSAREASTPALAEIVVTKQMDSAGAAKEKTEVSANVAPGSGKVFASAEALNGITFRWTPLVPKPQGSVTYRIKVWQLMDGQNSTQAMRTNKPIVSKDVDNATQATVSGIYTGPCKPPYLCDFVWGVAATSGGADMGMSAVTSFSVAAPPASTKSDSTGAAGTP